MLLDGGDDDSSAPARFELQEDPSFWKENNVQVVIRVRPLSSSEISVQGEKRCVRQDSCQSITWTCHPESRFTFDLVADEHITQESLFKVAGVPMVENCMAGYNSCMFAYGQTGSGKTHTMLGDIENGTRRNNENCGMTPRVFEHLFLRIQKEKEIRRDEKLSFTCKCSFLEIYNEQILDLLNPNATNLQLREDVKRGMHVENLTEHEVSNAREALQQLIEGAANRKVASTNMNRASSRSHSVFTCLIESKWESQGIKHHRFSHLNLVDLAGSERQKSSGAEGERLKEASNINKSLSTLGHVITSLIAVSNKKSQHVPYRDSKLTFLLQDSLGGNSKTTIIANISPSSCCAAETLSTLKFAQRAKHIRNNAIINEDASGDVLSMRLEIQHLKKELSRLQGQSEFTNSGFICESPSAFKWDQANGTFSPLMFDKRATQRRDYDITLAAAFRREQEKEAKLKAAIAAKQIAEELATQRSEEVRSFKMRLRFREDRIKRLEQVASGKLSAEAHLLQEKEDLMKEIEALRNQLERNPEITRFAMENLQLKEEIRRLQSFVDEGELERMHQQINVLEHQLLEALDWKLMNQKDPVNKDLSLFGEEAGDEKNEFLLVQAIQNEREIESLRKNLSVCLQAKEKLERRVDDLTVELEVAKKCNHENKEFKAAQHQEQSVLLDAQTELKTLVDAIATASQREAEAHETAIGLTKENEKLRTDLTTLIEDNKRLVDLYEQAIVNIEVKQHGNYPSIPQTEDSNEQQSSHPSNGGNDSLLDDQPEVAYGPPSDAVEEPVIVYENCSHKDVPSRSEFSELQLQLEEMHEENDKLMSLYEKAMQERDEFKRRFSGQSNLESPEDIQFRDAEMDTLQSNPETIEDIQFRDAEMDEAMDAEDFQGKHAHDSPIAAFKEAMQLVRVKLEHVQDKLVTAQDAVQYFKQLEMASTKAEELSSSIQLCCLDVQKEQEDINALKSALSESHERESALEGKFFLPAALCWDLHLKTEALAGSKFGVNVELMNKKMEQLSSLRSRKTEISAARAEARMSETELRNRIDGLKQKYRSFEAQRKETERVLFAIDNLDCPTTPLQKPMNFGKASELLKSEEERTKVVSELKKSRTQLSIVQKEIKSMRNCDDIVGEISRVESEMEDCLLSLLEADTEKFVRDHALAETWEVQQKDAPSLLVDYQDSVFQVKLEEEQVRACEASLQHQTTSLDEMKSKLSQAMRDLGELLVARGLDASMPHVSDKVKGDLDAIEVHVAEARQLLLVDDQTDL
ncbi:kinesin-like protein KIN-12G [Hordeum vulgare subsp. vulgare]|uniref:Kinesin motor domain-containing protein n=1 Tax=Hordeum vulgare subsp. vulgare TaxID=112509 RepID=A0A8I6YCE1_HORVV|nr:kinesin-like protein KIN-12G [Hordeum vulgare subsp. vulgare]